MSDDIEIEVLFVRPSMYSKEFEYIINDGQLHIMTKEEMFEMAFNLLPKRVELNYFLERRKPFVVLPKTYDIFEMDYEVSLEDRMNLLQNKFKETELEEHKIDNSQDSIVGRVIDRVTSIDFGKFFN